MRAVAMALLLSACRALRPAARWTRSVTRRAAATITEDMVPPVTLLSGFLGSGKTSMLTAILQNREDLKVAVVVNDVAAVNVDGSVVKRSLVETDGEPVELLELQNGCVCCGPEAEELATSIKAMVKGRGFDHVVVELSGVADPGVVKANLKMGSVDVKRVVTLVDAPAFCEQWMSYDVMEDRIKDENEDPYHPTSKGPALASKADLEADPCAAGQKVAALLAAQVECADVIAVNKIDVAAEDTEQAAVTCKALMPDALILRTEFGRAPLSELLPSLGCANTACEDAACADAKCGEEVSECANTACDDADCADASCGEAVCANTECDDADCADASCGETNHAHEWAGVFELQENSYEWTAQKVNGKYVGNSMRLVILKASANLDGLKSVEGLGEALIKGDTCEEVRGGSIIKPGRCSNLVFDQAKEETTFTLEGGFSAAVFAAKAPTATNALRLDGMKIEPRQEWCTKADCGEDHDHGHAHATPAVLATEFTSFVYTQQTPFNYDRLLGMISRWPIPQKTVLDVRDLVPGGAGVKGVKSPWEAVLRSKGTVWLDTHPRRMIQWAYAGRHFGLDDVGPWAGDTEQSEIVVIGMGLDEGKLRADLDEALVTESELRAMEEKVEGGGGLRFAIGTSVECNVGDDFWMRGTVVALDYVEDGWDAPAPYQVELDDGTLIFAPLDEDWVVRKQLKAKA